MDVPCRYFKALGQVGQRLRRICGWLNSADALPLSRLDAAMLRNLPRSEVAVVKQGSARAGTGAPLRRRQKKTPRSRI